VLGEGSAGASQDFLPTGVDGFRAEARHLARVANKPYVRLG
jgi:hypothetical protein